AGVHLGVPDVHAHVELRGDVPLGAGADQAQLPVRIAVGHVGDRARLLGGEVGDRGGVEDRGKEVAGAGLVAAGGGGDQRLGVVVVAHRGPAAVDRGLPLRVPHLLPGGVDAPGAGELDLAGAAVDAVHEPAQSHRVADPEAGGAAERVLGMADVAQGA